MRSCVVHSLDDELFQNVGIEVLLVKVAAARGEGCNVLILRPS